MALVLVPSAHGDLTDIINSGRFSFNALEQQAALANQAVFESLSQQCDSNRGCSGQQLQVLANVTELVHTANELLGSGPTSQSLGLDAAGLGFALRWTAAEELAAQGAMATEFTNGQLANLTSRLTALRYGATGFSIAAGHGIPATEADGVVGPGMAGLKRGAAAADEQLSRLGGFLNLSYGYGDKDPTDLEDAFDFDNVELTAGADYRFDSGLVLGGAFGYIEQETDFDASRSIVDGGFEADGYSLSGFAIYSPGAWYVSGLLSWQRIDYDLERFIKYPSLNPDVASVSTRTVGSTDSDALAISAGVGYTFQRGAFSAEPYLRSEYTDIEIDGFSERDLNNDGFDLTVDGQSFSSLDTAIGLRVASVVSTGFAVFIPYVRGEYHIESDDDARRITTDYNGVTTASGNQFALPTDEPDEKYYVVSAGVSVSLRGGRVRGDDNVVSGGLRSFAEYREVFSLRDISNQVITAGLRYEF